MDANDKGKCIVKFLDIYINLRKVTCLEKTNYSNEPPAYRLHLPGIGDYRPNYVSVHYDSDDDRDKGFNLAVEMLKACNDKGVK